MRRVTRRATTPATTAATIVLGAALAGVLTWACGSGDPSPLALVPDGGAPDASEPPPSADGGDADAGDPEAALFPAACARGAFCPVSGLFGATVDARVWLNDVAGTSASDVWAVGSRGTILHYDGKAWRVSLLPTNETLAHVLPRADGSVWATSSLARIHVRPANGGAWHAVAPTDDWGSVFVEACGVTDMWGSPDSEWVWFGVARAYGGTVPRLTRARGGVDGISVEAYGSGVGEAFGQTVHALAGHGSGELWGVGDLGSSFRITAASSETPGLEAFNTQTQGSLRGLSAAGAGELWAVGVGGDVRRRRATERSWDVVTGVRVSTTLHSVWARSSTDVWAVGDEATIVHFDGTSWARVPVAALGDRRPALFEVWGADAEHVWVVGEGVLLELATSSGGEK